MKRQLKTMAVILGLTVFAGAGAAQAQIIGNLKSNIPFSFYVRGKLMPAGAYTIAELNSGSGTMEIRSARRLGAHVNGFARGVCSPSCRASPMRIPSGPRM